MTYDHINPSHYRGDRKFEPIAVIEDWQLSYHLGNAVKYISRNGRKPNEDPVEGLRKAIWYLERQIELIEPTEVTYERKMEDAVYDAFLEWTVDEMLDETVGDAVYWNAAESGYTSCDVPDVDDQPLPGWDSDEGWMLERGGTPENPSGNYFLKRTPAATEAKEEDWVDFWATEDPQENCWVSLTEDEIFDVISRKDLNQFNEDEIVSTIEKRGMIIGVRKDGSTCVLNDQGKCS